MLMRALMHYEGQGGAVNFTKAIELYERAILLGNTVAMNNRAIMHQNGQGGAVNFTKAIELYERAILLGNTVAMFMRAEMHRIGQGGAVNFVRAIELCELAITLGSEQAMIVRACMYLKGQGGPEEVIKAIRLHRKAAEINKKTPSFSAFHSHLINLSDHHQNVFRYHLAMSQKDIAKAVDLMIVDFDLVFEFIAFDCNYMFINNPAYLQVIRAFVGLCVEINLDIGQLNELYVLVLT